MRAMIRASALPGQRRSTGRQDAAHAVPRQLRPPGHRCSAAKQLLSDPIQVCGIRGRLVIQGCSVKRRRTSSSMDTPCCVARTRKRSHWYALRLRSWREKSTRRRDAGPHRRASRCAALSGMDADATGERWSPQFVGARPAAPASSTCTPAHRAHAHAGQTPVQRLAHAWNCRSLVAVADGFQNPTRVYAPRARALISKNIKSTRIGIYSAT